MDDKINYPEENKAGKLELIAARKFPANPEIYRIVDFLNRSLKQYHLMFGLTKKDEDMSIMIYEVE